MSIELPDIDRLYELIEEATGLMKRKGSLENTIKDTEALVSKKMTEDESFFDSKGKPPSQTSIDNTYKRLGFNNELIPIRAELVEVEAELENRKMLIDAYKRVIDLYRTEAANERTLAL